VTTTGGQVVVHTKGPTVVTINEDLIQSFLHTSTTPHRLHPAGHRRAAHCDRVLQPTLLIGLVGALCLALSSTDRQSAPQRSGRDPGGVGCRDDRDRAEPSSHGILTVGGIVVFVVGAVAFLRIAGSLPADLDSGLARHRPDGRGCGRVWTAPRWDAHANEKPAGAGRRRARGSR